MNAFLSFLSTNYFSLASILIAIAALAVGIWAAKLAQKAVREAKEAALSSLRVRAYESWTNACLSFRSLQSECKDTESKWKIHNGKHMPKMGFHRCERNEDVLRIRKTQAAGQEILNSVKPQKLQIEKMTNAELEVYIKQVDGITFQLEGLKLQLEEPKPLHF